MSLFSITVLSLIPLPTFVLGAAMFFHAYRDAGSGGATTRFYRALFLLFTLFFALGGVAWMVLCFAIWRGGLFG